MSIESQHRFQAISLGFLAGYVNTVGFVALFGLMTALVTGNFILIGANLVSDSSSAVMIKFLAFPAFILGIAAIRILTIWLDSKHQQNLQIQLTVLLQLVLLVAFMITGILASPLGKEPSTIAIICGMFGAAAMGAHSAYTRLLLPHLAPTSMMTGNVTQIVLDAMELLLGKGDSATRARMSKSLWTIAAFATGAIVAGFCYVAASFWALLLPIAILIWLLRKEHYCNLEATQTL
jgi:uncharacterized membrane protein YoaK (UPF0700 family)